MVRNLFALAAMLQWSFHAGASIVAPPVQAGHNVIITDTRGEVIALDARTGKPRWSTILENGIYAGAIVYRGRVIVSTGTPLLTAVQPPNYAISVSKRHSDIVALNARTGDILWEYDLAGSGASASALVGDRLIHHDGSAEVLAVRAYDGSYFWRTFAGSAAASSAAAAMAGNRFATTGAFPNCVLVMRASDGTILERTEFPASAIGFAQAPIVTDGTAIYGTYFLPGALAVQHLYSVDGATGRVKWDASENRGRGSAALPRLSVSRGVIFEGSPFASTLQAIDANTGAFLWQAPLHGRAIGAPLLRGNRVYAADSRGWIDAFDRRTGAVVGSYDAGEDLGETTAAAIGDALVVGSRSGVIRSIPFADI